MGISPLTFQKAHLKRIRLLTPYIFRSYNMPINLGCLNEIAHSPFFKKSTKLYYFCGLDWCLIVLVLVGRFFQAFVQRWGVRLSLKYSLCNAQSYILRSCIRIYCTLCTRISSPQRTITKVYR